MTIARAFLSNRTKLQACWHSQAAMRCSACFSLNPATTPQSRHAWSTIRSIRSWPVPVDPEADDFEARFYEAGCDDAGVGFQNGHSLLDPEKLSL